MALDSWHNTIVARTSDVNGKDQAGNLNPRIASLLAKFEAGIDATILGHCHLPAIRAHTVGARRRQFVLLGDWLKHRSYLVMDSGGFELRYYVGKPF